MPARGSGAHLLELAAGTSPAGALERGKSAEENNEAEGVFEIRDFTNASAFERLVWSQTVLLLGPRTP